MLHTPGRSAPEADPSALTLLTKQLYRHVGEHSWPYNGRLVFEPSGAARLAGIAGFLHGLASSGQRALAAGLAADLHEKLTYLSAYGGQREFPRRTGEGSIEVPAYKVVLGDDGTFGGFAIGWYRAIPNSRRLEVAEEIMKAEYGDEIDYDHTDYHGRWDQAIKDAEAKLSIRKDLEDWRGYFPSWDLKRERYTSESVQYGFAFNGGLLLHGMGHSTFAVELVPEAGPHWSIHT